MALKIMAIAITIKIKKTFRFLFTFTKQILQPIFKNQFKTCLLFAKNITEIIIGA